MAKYFIREETELGQDLLEVVGLAMTMIGNDEGLTKTKILEAVNDIMRQAKRIRNKLTIQDQYELNNYRMDADVHDVEIMGVDA